MMLPESYFILTAAIAAILGFATFYQLLKKKLTDKVLKYGALSFAILVFVMIKFSGRKVYVIEPDLTVYAYYALGSFTVEMEEKAGAKVNCQVHHNRVGIVNQSRKTLRIEEVTYGSSPLASSGDHALQIEACSFKEVFLKRGLIDFFFDTPPEEIKVVGLSHEETKYWIHTVN
ncbi:MAG: hypothetical protein KDD41_12755 [Flavobacteriales bacterium]|nr:hypothetical protein [Flavobacteriales bacterium]